MYLVHNEEFVIANGMMCYDLTFRENDDLSPRPGGAWCPMRPSGQAFPECSFCRNHDNPDII